MLTEELLEWLLAGDVAVQYQVHRDLLGEDRPDLQDRIASEGHGAALLAARGPSGHWGSGFYQPKWTSSHYTLLELKTLGLPPSNAVTRETVQRILAVHVARDGGLDTSGSGGPSDVCVNGMALGYAAHFGATTAQLRSVAEVLLESRMADGGFNCRWRRGATHGSVHSTICVLEGVTEYRRRGHDHRVEELAAAADGAVEFLLRHRLYRSERTGEAINPEFTRLHFPARWRYDILRCLDALRDAGVAHDPRMGDALDLLAERRRPDGKWVLNAHYPGATHAVVEPAGRPSRWITLMALRVLARYGHAAGVGFSGAR